MAQYSAQIKHWLAASEGTYVDNPADPGGATNHGVTRKVLAAWRGISPWWKLPKAAVKALTLNEAQRIFKANYWKPVMGDQLPPGLDYAVFDYAVHSGVSRAVKDVQRCLGKLYDGRIDGIMGLQTLSAIKRMDNVEGLIRALCQRRYAFLKGLSSFKTFGRGWTRRVMGNRMGAQPGADIGVIDRAVMLYQGATDIPAPAKSAPHKAMPEPAKIGDVLKSAGGAGVTVSGASSVVAAIADNQVLSIGLAIIAVGAAALAGWWVLQKMHRGEFA